MARLVFLSKLYVKNVATSINKIKPENYRNYFQDAYERKHGLEYSKPSTRKCKPKNIKNKLYML